MSHAVEMAAAASATSFSAGWRAKSWQVALYAAEASYPQPEVTGAMYPESTCIDARHDGTSADSGPSSTHAHARGQEKAPIRQGAVDASAIYKQRQTTYMRFPRKLSPNTWLDRYAISSRSEYACVPMSTCLLDKRVMSKQALLRDAVLMGLICWYCLCDAARVCQWYFAYGCLYVLS